MAPARQAQSNRLFPKRKKAIPSPTPLTRQQIAYLAHMASDKQKNDSEPWTAVPNPIPDTAIRSSAQHDLKFSSASVLPSRTTLSLPSSSPSIYPLFSTLANPAITPPTPASAAMASVTSLSAPHEHHIPAGSVSLIAVGGAFLLLGCFVAIRLCVRPARRSIPVPSRPILDDSFLEDDVFRTKLEDSPVFGGKERLSERPGNSGLWNWTQYSTPATTTVAPSTSYGHQISTEKAHPLPDDAADFDVSAPSLYPMQQAHNVFTRAANRLSMASVYPASPANNQNYGLVTTFTADGHPVMERVTPKVLQRSRSSTMGERNRDRPPSRTTRYSYGFAYDGAEVMSPQMTVQSPPTTFTPAMPGRTRIKSSYYAHPRISVMPSSQTTKVNVRHEAPPVSLEQSGPPAAKNTTSYYLSSPQPTLYPDDSLSVVDSKRPPKRVHKKPVPSNRASRVFGRAEDGVPYIASPTLDATAALGSLMLMDFGGSGQNAVDFNLTSTSSATLTPKKGVSRSDDKPPRVPSPPPLPSLTQMGLEHANPEAYAEYRSPTYSIYGLYEADRKSHAAN